MADYNANKDLSDFDTSDMFKNISKEKIEPIKELIKEIEFLISNRAEVNAEMNKSIDKMQMEIDNFLLGLPKIKSVGESTNLGGEVVKAMSELRKMKIELEQTRLEEKLNYWRDVAQLQRELREYARELKEKESKSELLDSLI